MSLAGTSSTTRRLDDSKTPAEPGRKRVVFVNRYFHPDHSATSQIASDLAFHLAARERRLQRHEMRID